MIRHLPNALSLLRILLAPAVGFFLFRDQPGAALPLLAAAALSDALDGWLARRLDAATPLGASLDPVADKLLAAAVFVGLAGSGRLPWWLVALVLGRDVLILAFAAWAMRFTRLRRFPPSLWGKLSTVLQLSLGIACVLHAATGAVRLESVRQALVPVVAAATVWSGLHYGWQAGLALRRTAD